MTITLTWNAKSGAFEMVSCRASAVCDHEGCTNVHDDVEIGILGDDLYDLAAVDEDGRFWHLGERVLCGEHNPENTDTDTETDEATS
jgi:hypothetical protein